MLWKLTAADQAQLGVGAGAGSEAEVVNFSPSWGVGSEVGPSNASLPSNIRVIEWAPQNDILGHPATRAFLTQAGTNSFNEVSSTDHMASAIILRLYRTICLTFN